MGNRYISNGSDIIELSLCGKCKHKHKGKATCLAFPAGIPNEFLMGKRDHTKAYQNDNGIRFEPIQGK